VITFVLVFVCLSLQSGLCENFWSGFRVTFIIVDNYDGKNLIKF